MSFFLVLALLAMIFGSLLRCINCRGPQLVALTHEYFFWLTLFPKGEHSRWEAEVALPTEFGARFIVLHAGEASRR